MEFSLSHSAPSLFAQFVKKNRAPRVFAINNQADSESRSGVTADRFVFHFLPGCSRGDTRCKLLPATQSSATLRESEGKREKRKRGGENVREYVSKTELYCLID